MLNTVIKGQNDTKTQQEAVLKRIGDIEIELKDLNKELNVLIDSINECPTCGQAVTEECKEGLKS